MKVLRILQRGEPLAVGDVNLLYAVKVVRGDFMAGNSMAGHETWARPLNMALAPAELAQALKDTLAAYDSLVTIIEGLHKANLPETRGVINLARETLGEWELSQ